jgi:hypothetical protein
MKGMKKFCGTIAWPMYILGKKEKQSLNGTLSYYMILQLELFCQKAGKCNQIPYVQGFVQLHNKEPESQELN